MEFKFSANEEYQVQAIKAVTGLIEGQPLIRSQLTIPKGAFSKSLLTVWTSTRLIS